MKKIGLIVNPVAGMGGSVGLKGTDGEIIKDAIKLGAKPVAPKRVDRFLSQIESKNEIFLLVAPGKMGEEYVKNRGLELKVEHEEDIKRTNLTEDQAEDILTQAIGLYKRQHNNDRPNRIVVHKKSGYTEEENEGFFNATQNIEIQDFIHIKENLCFLKLKTILIPFIYFLLN